MARQTGFEDIRLYAAHRFEEAEVIQTTAEKPSDFDLDRYIDSGAMNFEADKKIRLRATVRESLAYYLTEGPLGEDQRLRAGKDKNEWKLSVTVRESWELWFWILSQGRNITVEQPKSLAKRPPRRTGVHSQRVSKRLKVNPDSATGRGRKMKNS